MAKSVLYMSMSLDGFITGPDDGPDNGLGTGGNRLHEWLGESLDATRADLAAKGIESEPIEYPGGPAGPRTCWITDPDGYRIEVLQWPDGHADGITKADFA